MPAAYHSQNEIRNETADNVPVVAGGLSSYEIGPAIGKGGYAVVYKGIRRQDGLVVAIKR
jgi:NIMA (never in mitosis gene a)-related kinase